MRPLTSLDCNRVSAPRNRPQPRGASRYLHPRISRRREILRPGVAARPAESPRPGCAPRSAERRPSFRRRFTSRATPRSLPELTTVLHQWGWRFGHFDDHHQCLTGKETLSGQEEESEEKDRQEGREEERQAEEAG